MVTMASSGPSNAGGTPLPPDVSTTTVQKKASENRRSNKPIMEKKRRARINNSLNELKSLILDAMKKDPARHSKLEKADILEMAVKHLESLHKQQAAMSTLTDKYRAGFTECAGEVNRFPGLEPIVRRRLIQHLSNCLASAAVPNNETKHNLQVSILRSEQVAVATGMGTDQSGIFLSAGVSTGLQLVPTRLPNGDFAFILPSNSATNMQQRLPLSPTPSSSSSSPPPLTRIHQSRSSTFPDSDSSIGFECLSVNIAASSSPIDDMCPSPSSILSHYSSYPHSPDSNSTSSRNDSYTLYSPPLQKPLSLVLREGYVNSNDDKPWRPW